jgi:hypothetical protein
VFGRVPHTIDIKQESTDGDVQAALVVMSTEEVADLVLRLAAEKKAEIAARRAQRAV